MTTWNPETLDQLSKPHEMKISSRRDNGTHSNPVIIWSVKVGDQFFARSVYGPEKPWYRAVANRGVGRITVSGETLDVNFEAPYRDHLDDIDEAYRQKYAGYPTIVTSCVTAEARSATIRITPAS